MQARPIFFLCTIHAVTLLQCWYHCPATKTPHVVVTSQGQYLCLCTHRCPVLTELETLQQSFSHTQGCSSQLAGQTSQTHQSSTRATALFQAFKRCSAAEESWKAWERAWYAAPAATCSAVLLHVLLQEVFVDTTHNTLHHYSKEQSVYLLL